MSKIEDFNTQIKKTVTAKDLKASVKKINNKSIDDRKLTFFEER